jgi:pilus assembly protein Flp/PilA
MLRQFSEYVQIALRAFEWRQLMHRFLAHYRQQLASEIGQDAAEYALLIGLIALAIVLAVTALGGSLTAVYEAITAAIPPF